MEKNIMNATDKEIKEADKWYIKHHKEEGVQQAIKIVEKLGLNGIWRGYFLAIKTVYEYKYVLVEKEGKLVPKGC